jgi:hemoglobin
MIMALKPPKKDIENLNDIKKLVNNFYIKVVPDELLGPVFEDIAKTDWVHHLPKMYDFWETLLLSNRSYQGNPMTRHIELDQESRLLPGHFTRWLALFKETVDEYFSGQIAEKAKEKAETIAGIMENKLKQSRY